MLGFERYFHCSFLGFKSYVNPKIFEASIFHARSFTVAPWNFIHRHIWLQLITTYTTIWGFAARVKKSGQKAYLIQTRVMDMLAHLSHLCKCKLHQSHNKEEMGSRMRSRFQFSDYILSHMHPPIGPNILQALCSRKSYNRLEQQTWRWRNSVKSYDCLKDVGLCSAPRWRPPWPPPMLLAATPFLCFFNLGFRLGSREDIFCICLSSL